MPKLITKTCPHCGKLLTILPEASVIGIVCPQCKEFIGDKTVKMSDEEIKRITAAIHEMLSGKQ